MLTGCEPHRAHIVRNHNKNHNNNGTSRKIVSTQEPQQNVCSLIHLRVRCFVQRLAPFGRDPLVHGTGDGGRRDDCAHPTQHHRAHQEGAGFLHLRRQPAWRPHPGQWLDMYLVAHGLMPYSTKMNEGRFWYARLMTASEGCRMHSGDGKAGINLPIIFYSACLFMQVRRCCQSAP